MAKTIEIKFTVDVDNRKEVENLIDILYGFLPEGYVKAEAEEEEEAPKKESPKKESPKKESPKKIAPKKVEAVEEEEDEEEEASDIKIEDVRSLLAKKVKDHRDAIKGQLTELGASNVISLDSSKYPEFIDFLNSL